MAGKKKVDKFPMEGSAMPEIKNEIKEDPVTGAITGKMEPLVIVLDDNQKAFMRAVIEATNKGDFIHVGSAFAAPLLEVGLIIVNPDFKNEAGEIASRATPKGIEFMSEATPPDNGAKELPTHNSLGIKIVRNIPIPESKRASRGRGTVYPFETMEVGESFFIPDSIGEDGKVIEAAKKFASTVSSANQRFAVEVPGEFREKRIYQKYENDFHNEAGNVVYKKGDQAVDAHGNRIFKVEQVPKTVQTKNFVIRSIPDGKPWGDEFAGKKGAGIWRMK